MMASQRTTVTWTCIVLLGAVGCSGDAERWQTVTAAELPQEPRAYVFPGERWARVADVANLGWDGEALRALEEWAPSAGSSAGLVVHRGVVVASWGETTERENSQSLRKSLVSGLIGSLVADGRIRLEQTLAELEIDDQPPLTPRERTATVRHLLHSRSGVYHSAIYEFPEWKERKPERGAHAPGEHFFYNNWDFNVLETLAERAAGEPLGEAFARRIAEPIGMEDFRPRDVVELDQGALTERFMGNESLFPAHIFMISARDLARYGLLYLADGRWNETRILPESWVRGSTQGLPTDRNVEYGYLWWVDPDGTWFPGPDLGLPLYFGRGSRGHYLLVIPSLDLVVVNRVKTGGVGLFAQLRRRLLGSGRVSEADFADMLRRVIAAHPDGSADAHAAMGLLFINLADYDAAQAYLERALELNPSLTNANHWRGLVFSRRGEMRRAVESGESFADLDPLFLVNLGNQVAHLGAIGAFEDAEALARRIRRSHPEYGLAQFGFVLRSQGRLAEAVEDLESISAASGDRRLLRLQLEETWYRLGDYARSLETSVGWSAPVASIALDRGDEGGVATRAHLEASPLDFVEWWGILHGLSLAGRHQELLDRVDERWSDPAELNEFGPFDFSSGGTLGPLAVAQRALGRDDELAATVAYWGEDLERLEGNGYANSEFAFAQASFLAVSGDREQALERLRVAIDRGHRDPLLGRSPPFEPWWDDPEFRALVERNTELIDQERAKLGMEPLG
ncbi:MAG: serine hydrolase [Gemmatimonadota bacterium]